MGNDNTIDNQRGGAVVDAYSTRMDGLLAKDSMTDKEQASKNLDLSNFTATQPVSITYQETKKNTDAPRSNEI